MNTGPGEKQLPFEKMDQMNQEIRHWDIQHDYGKKYREYYDYGTYLLVISLNVF